MELGGYRVGVRMWVPCQLDPMVVPAGVGIWVRFSLVSLISVDLLGDMQAVGVGRYLASDLAWVAREDIFANTK